jgi:hypothetical protein
MRKAKTEEIGGWLLLFYIQAYGGVISMVVVAVLSFQNYFPSEWAANPSLYPLWLLSTAPAQLLQVIVLVVAERLRRTREYRFVETLRTVLWMCVAAAGVAIVIDWAQFPKILPFNVLPLISAAGWLAYFYRSTRVARVFKTKDWFVPTSAAPGIA